MKYQTIVWDLDGTLSDSAPGILASIRYALNRMGREIPDEKVLRRFLGPPLAASFIEYCGMTAEEAKQAAAYYRECYHGGEWMNNCLYPSILRLLIDLKRKGACLAVATGKPKVTADMVLRYFGIMEMFDKVVGPEECNMYAKKEDAISEAIRGQANAVMIGDRHMDIIGAHKAGIPCIAAGYGYGSKEEAEQANSDFYAETVSELYDLLDVPKENEKGYFISVEGNDGCGKSTQIRLLTERLKKLGLTVQRTREPGGCPLAEKIRAILLDKENSTMFGMTEALLFAASRAQHVREVIAPSLEKGNIVVSDRFVDSSIAYQGAGQGLGEHTVSSINAYAVDRWMPDTTVYLDIDYKTAMSRREKASETDRIELYKDGFHYRAQQSFRRLCAEAPQRFLHIDALGSPEEIGEKVFQGVAARIREKL